MARTTYSPGKCDYNRSGRKNCEVTFDIEFTEGRFSVSATIWNPSELNAYTCGQCVAEAASYFPDDAKTQEILALWRDWHLNDMQAGSPAQTACLKQHKYEGGNLHHFEESLQVLTKAGLQPDPSYLHNGEPYSYGSTWLTVDLPPDVLTRVQALFI